jgi:hypothetical protein
MITFLEESSHHRPQAWRLITRPFSGWAGQLLLNTVSGCAMSQLLF